MESTSPWLGTLERELDDYTDVDHRSDVIINGVWRLGLTFTHYSIICNNLSGKESEKE